MAELRKFVNGGMEGEEFINSVSGIVNRGCHNPVSVRLSFFLEICLIHLDLRRFSSRIFMYPFLLRSHAAQVNSTEGPNEPKIFFAF